MTELRAPVIVTRNEWGAEAFRGELVVQPRYDNLVIHHAAGFLAGELEASKHQMRDIQKLHQDTNGWDDIGYHFLLDGAGTVFQGRPFVPDSGLEERPDLVVGAHVARQNTGKIGICVLGCYHPEETDCDNEVTPAILESVVSLASFLCRQYEIDASAIKGHRDFKETACPGSKLYVLLDEIRDRVAGR